MIKIVNSLDRSSFVRTQRGNILRLLLALFLLATIPLAIWGILTQRIELRKRASMPPPPVCWNRIINGPETLARGATPFWPDGCKGMPPATNRFCTEATVALTASEVYEYKKWIDAGKPAIADCDFSPPNPPILQDTIRWTTADAMLLANDLTITAYEKTFTGTPDSGTTVSVSSDPTNSGDPSYTTLEATWTEQGIEMRMFMYFRLRCTRALLAQCSWHVTEVRIYNGKTPGDWIYFKGEDVTGLTAAQSQTYANPSFKLTSSENEVGGIQFTNLKLRAFLRPGPTPTPTPIPGCYYQQVQCVKAPCDPVLVCPTPVVNSCTNAGNGSPCTIGACPTCPPGRMCPAIACILQTGTCQEGQCVPQNCVPQPRCPEPLVKDQDGQWRCSVADYKPGVNYCPITPTPTCTPLPKCATEGIAGPNGTRVYCTPASLPGRTYCPKPSCAPIPPGCTDARGNVTCQSILPWCPPTPTCTPRPACLDTTDPKARCFMPDIARYCPPTPTPTPAGKTADLNGDGKVNIFDYNILLQNFGKTGAAGFIPADIDRNGKVDIFDHKLLLEQFGT